jgi:3-oxoacyl-(acyl-carrier-protein) synthase
LHQPEGAEDQVVSIDGELDLLRRFYGAAIDATRRSVPKRERAAAIRALRRELKAAILAVTTRHRNEQASRRAALRRRREAHDYTIK